MRTIWTMRTNKNRHKKSAKLQKTFRSAWHHMALKIVRNSTACNTVSGFRLERQSSVNKDSVSCAKGAEMPRKYTMYGPRSGAKSTSKAENATPASSPGKAAANAGNAASGERPDKKWKRGDRVCFAHDLDTSWKVEGVQSPGNEPSVQLEGMSGFFASHLFVADPAREAPVTDADLEAQAYADNERYRFPAQVRGEPANENAGPAICPICREPMSAHGYRHILTAGMKPKREVCPPGAIERAAMAPANLVEKQEWPAPGKIEARDEICFTCEERVATHTVRVCGPCIGESTEEDFAPPLDLPPFIVEARGAPDPAVGESGAKKPYSTPTLTGPSRVFRISESQRMALCSVIAEQMRTPDATELHIDCSRFPAVETTLGDLLAIFTGK